MRHLLESNLTYAQMPSVQPVSPIFSCWLPPPAPCRLTPLSRSTPTQGQPGPSTTYQKLLANLLLGFEENHTAGGMCWHSTQPLKELEDFEGVMRPLGKLTNESRRQEDWASRFLLVGYSEACSLLVALRTSPEYSGECTC